MQSFLGDLLINFYLQDFVYDTFLELSHKKHLVYFKQSNEFKESLLTCQMLVSAIYNPLCYMLNYFLSLFHCTPCLVQFCITVYLECHTKQIFLHNMLGQRSINVQKVDCGYLLLYHWINMKLHHKKICIWENVSISTNFQAIIPLWYQYIKIWCESRNINLESVSHLSYIISLYLYLYLFIYLHLSPSICYCKIVLRNINWSHDFKR